VRGRHLGLPNLLAFSCERQREARAWRAVTASRFVARSPRAGQQFIDAAGRMILHAREHIGEVS